MKTQTVTFKSALPPVLIALGVWALFNAACYGWLSRPPKVTWFKLPLTQTFDTPTKLHYVSFKGQWQSQDGTYVQKNGTDYDLGAIIPMKIPQAQSYQFSAKLRYLQGSMGGGVLFNMQHPTNLQKSQMARFNVDSGVVYLLYGYYDAQSVYNGQGSAVLNFAPDNADWHTLAVQVSAETYNLLVDGVEVAAGVPLNYQGGSIGLVTSTSQVAFDDLAAEAWTPSGESIAAAPTPVPVEVSNSAEGVIAAGANLAAWTVQSGNWTFAPGAITQQQQDGYDFAAIFTAQPFENYRLRVRLHHQSGLGGGVFFNVPDPASKSGAHLVRYMDDGLAWGYFDQNGDFQSQGFVPVPAPGVASHQLEVVSQAGTYALILDGTSVAENIPLTSTRGYIGLTSSQSVTVFESVEVIPAESSLQLSALNGQWQSDNGQFTQTGTDAVDYVAATGISADAFTLGVDILLPADTTWPDVGGGVIFDMRAADDFALGTLVRFSDNGQTLFWGTFDENRAFTGSGSVPLALDWSVPHRLQITVQSGRYAISVDGQAIAADLPTAQPGGWIGLASFRGPVTFSNFYWSAETP